MNMRLLISGATLAAMMSGVPAILHAQSACMAYEPLRRVMQENKVYMEGSGHMQIADGRILATQIWVSPSGDWAVIGVDETGIACIIMSGIGWTKPERL
jgi:hypothetical protein